MQLDSGKVFRFGDEVGQPLPSIVAVDKATGRHAVGRQVWLRRENYFKNGQHHVIQAVKGRLGTPESWHTEVGAFTPEDIAAQILQSLNKRVVERGLPGGIDEAVVTIPVNYLPEQRHALRSSAAKVGIEITCFVNEPTAAIMPYIQDLRHCRYLAVFDWGGGTLDISVLEIRKHRIYELATNVLAQGGDMIDNDLAAAIHEEVMNDRGETLPFASVPPPDRDSLRAQCENAKRHLSDEDQAEISLVSYCGRPLTYTVEKRWFEDIVWPYVDRGVELLRSTIQHAELPFESITRLLVTGGSSNLRLLHETLQTDPQFGKAFLPARDAQWDVAQGAAILHSAPGGDELAESIGLILSDGSFYELIRDGERPSADMASIAVSLVEDSDTAHIVVAKRRLDERRNPLQPERMTMFGVKTNGFDAERITIRYGITQDLSFRIEAFSHALGPRATEVREYGHLRFAYALPG